MLPDSLRSLANDIRHGRDPKQNAEIVMPQLMAYLERHRKNSVNKQTVEGIKLRELTAKSKRRISKLIDQLEQLDRRSSEYHLLAAKIENQQEVVNKQEIGKSQHTLVSSPLIRQIEDIGMGIVADYLQKTQIHLGSKYMDGSDAANKLDQIANMLEWPEFLPKQVRQIYYEMTCALKDGKSFRRGSLCRKTRFLIAKAVKEPFLFECIENRSEDAVSASRKLEFEELEVVEFAKQYIAEKHKLPIQHSPKAVSTDNLIGEEASADARSNKAYEWPDEYDRDKWIYDNIDQHRFSDTVTKLQNLCAEKAWSLVESRNGIKKISDRFAKFHGFEVKRFPRKATK